MRHRLVAVAATALLACVGTAHAQNAPPPASDVSGTWELTWETPRGPTTMALELRADGRTLTGRVETRAGWNDITDGTVDGSAVSFAVQITRGERSFRMQFDGKLTDDGTLEGTVNTPRGDAIPWTAKRKTS